eukprot:1157638-Pelagomonas_calceolata.AAC.3
MYFFICNSSPQQSVALASPPHSTRGNPAQLALGPLHVVRHYNHGVHYADRNNVHHATSESTFYTAAH